jgi:hypothetical protein
MKLLYIASTMMILTACTWVDLTPEGSNVRVITQQELSSSCVRTGATHVSVLDRVLLERASSAILLELQALARNQAAERGDDTVVATSSIVEGEQDFDLYRCNQN